MPELNMYTVRPNDGGVTRFVTRGIEDILPVPEIHSPLLPPTDAEWDEGTDCTETVCTPTSTSSADESQILSSVHSPLFIDASSTFSQQQAFIEEHAGPVASYTGVLSNSPVSFTLSPADNSVLIGNTESEFNKEYLTKPRRISSPGTPHSAPTSTHHCWDCGKAFDPNSFWGSSIKQHGGFGGWADQQRASELPEISSALQSAVDKMKRLIGSEITVTDFQSSEDNAKHDALINSLNNAVNLLHLLSRNDETEPIESVSSLPVSASTPLDALTMALLAPLHQSDAMPCYATGFETIRFSSPEACCPSADPQPLTTASLPQGTQYNQQLPEINTPPVPMPNQTELHTNLLIERLNQLCAGQSSYSVIDLLDNLRKAIATLTNNIPDTGSDMSSVPRFTSVGTQSEHADDFAVTSQTATDSHATLGSSERRPALSSSRGRITFRASTGTNPLLARQVVIKSVLGKRSSASFSHDNHSSSIDPATNPGPLNVEHSAPRRKQRALSESLNTTLADPSQSHLFPLKSDVKKCRKVYGIENRSQWCNQCRWKKACRRFPDVVVPSTSRPVSSNVSVATTCTSPVMSTQPPRRSSAV